MSTRASIRRPTSPPAINFTPDTKFRREPPTSYPSAAMNSHDMSGPAHSTSYPSAAMNPHDMSSPAHSFMHSHDMSSPAHSIADGMNSWTPSPHIAKRTRPVTIHEASFPFCVPEEYSSLPAWDSSTMAGPHDGFPQTYGMQQDYFSPHNVNQWTQKTCEDSIEFPGLDSDMSVGQAYTPDEVDSVLDLRYSESSIDSESLHMDPRRISGSSFATNDTFADMASYDDLSVSLSETPSFGSSENPYRSNRNSMMSSTQLSPVASPRMTPQYRTTELVRTQSRGRASPNMRSAPYSSLDAGRNKRWSTGSYGTPSRRPSPFIYQSQEHITTYLMSAHSSPTINHNNALTANLNNMQPMQPQTPQYLLHKNAEFHHNAMLLSSHNYLEPTHFEAPTPPQAYMSHGLFRMLQSNADPHSLHSHYADLSDPPDLYASLNEEQIPPPPEDMNPSDPDMIPHEQELRFDGDLYTPRWVRGHGNKREGWCGICKPGRWLVLKNSAFWYDKSFTHGISAATGNPFNEPQETRRMDGNPDVWEGLCGSCNEWVSLVSSKKKGTTWFRHAYKCHTHPKIKDAPKRRRESSHTRALAASTMAKPIKLERPHTPSRTPSSHSVSGTPTASTISTKKFISPLQEFDTQGGENMI